MLSRKLNLQTKYMLHLQSRWTRNDVYEICQSGGSLPNISSESKWSAAGFLGWHVPLLQSSLQEQKNCLITCPTCIYSQTSQPFHLSFSCPPLQYTEFFGRAESAKMTEVGTAGDWRLHTHPCLLTTLSDACSICISWVLLKLTKLMSSGVLLIMSWQVKGMNKEMYLRKVWPIGVLSMLKWWRKWDWELEPK